MGIFDIFKKKDNKPAEVKTPVREPEIAPQSVPKRVWESKKARVDLIDGVLKKMEITRDENDDYTLKKKELIEDFEGEKVWKYEPYEFKEWRIEETNVFVKDEYGEEYLIGTIGPRIAKDILAEQPDKPDMMLFGGKYKWVTDEDVGTDEADLSVVIGYEKLKK